MQQEERRTPFTPVPGGDGLDLLPRTQRELLVHLKLAGRQSASQLSDTLFLSPSATRQLLQALERAELVSWERTPTPAGGRPTHSYTLTPRGHRLFPTLGPLALRHVADAVGAHHPQLLQQALDSLLEGLPGAAGPVPEFFAHNGYLPTARAGTDGREGLELFHCPLWDLAQGTAAICDAELRLLKRLTDGDVERGAHRLAGDYTCSYRYRSGPGAARAEAM